MATKYVKIPYTVTDVDDDEVTQTFQYSVDDINFFTATMNTGHSEHNFTSVLAQGMTAAGVAQTVIHDVQADLGPDFIGTIFYKTILDDGTVQVEFDTSFVANLASSIGSIASGGLVSGRSGSGNPSSKRGISSRNRRVSQKRQSKSLELRTRF